MREVGGCVDAVGERVPVGREGEAGETRIVCAKIVSLEGEAVRQAPDAERVDVWGIAVRSVEIGVVAAADEVLSIGCEPERADDARAR